MLLQGFLRVVEVACFLSDAQRLTITLRSHTTVFGASLLNGSWGMQNDAEKQRCVDMAAAEIQSILQGQRVQKGGPYQPASQRAFIAVGPPQQVQHHTCIVSSPLMRRVFCAPDHLSTYHCQEVGLLQVARFSSAKHEY